MADVRQFRLLDGCWKQRHIYYHEGAHWPFLTVWTLEDDNGWQEQRVYMRPQDIALVEMSRRFVPSYPPAGWSV